MEQSTAVESEFRILGLGNPMLADDAFGIAVAEQLQDRFGPSLDVVTASASGFSLLDHLLGTTRVLIVDSIITGRVQPGTLSLFGEDQLRSGRACAPHGAGLYEALETARTLHLPVASEVVVIAVEAGDCTTMGGPMHPDVEAAIASAVSLASRLITRWRETSRAIRAAGAYV